MGEDSLYYAFYDLLNSGVLSDRPANCTGKLQIENMLLGEMAEQYGEPVDPAYTDSDDALWLYSYLLQVTKNYAENQYDYHAAYYDSRPYEQAYLRAFLNSPGQRIACTPTQSEQEDWDAVFAGASAFATSIMTGDLQPGVEIDADIGLSEEDILRADILCTEETQWELSEDLDGYVLLSITLQTGETVVLRYREADESVSE
jgi:hypothetical protein